MSPRDGGARQVAGGYAGAAPHSQDLKSIIKIESDHHELIHSGIDPTNNWAELLVREVVKQRIMRQALRTMEGAETFSTILSCLGTWHLSGLNVKRQLEKFLGA